MSFKPYTEKIKKKKIGICSILGRIRIHHPGTDPQNRIRIKMTRIRNTDTFYEKYLEYQEGVGVYTPGMGWIGFKIL